MPTDSIVGAVSNYIRALTIPGFSSVGVYRDEVPQATGGGQVAMPYVVLREQGGRAIRDLEGNHFGTQPVLMTVWGAKAGDAEGIASYIAFGGEDPKNRAGIEADNALIPTHLSGHSVGNVFVQDTGQEQQSPTRRADQLAFTCVWRLTVNFQRA